MNDVVCMYVLTYIQKTWYVRMYACMNNVVCMYLLKYV